MTDFGNGTPQPEPGKSSLFSARCGAKHPDSDKGYAPVHCQRPAGHSGDHCATTKGPQDQWWTEPKR